MAWHPHPDTCCVFAAQHAMSLHKEISFELEISQQLAAHN